MAKRDCTELCFDGPLTVAAADKVRDELVAAIVKGGDIVIDCSAADSIDLSFVQLVVAAREAAQANGATLSLRSPASGPLLETLQRGGFLAEDGMGSAEAKFWMKEEV